MARLSAAGQLQIPMRLHVLGPFRLERGSKLVHLNTRKVESLFAYLALHSGPHRREKLAALLWGDSPDKQARHSLRAALTAIRQELGDVVLADRETVQLDPEASLWVDAREFQSAPDLYRGDLLTDFYDEWILPEREHLHAMYLDVMLQLVQAARSQSEYSRSIELARKVLGSDPANETAYQHIIFCLAATGDRIGALKQFDECANKLRDELGVEPSKETVALRDRIEQELTGGQARHALFTNLPMALAPFIGRAAELAIVKPLLERHRLLTLTGSGGCGKTRLAIEIARSRVADEPNGVWWVDLAPLSDPALVAQTVAYAMGVPQAPQQSPEETLVNFLRAKQLLLVLDNCEHLIAACARLVDHLLSTCAELKILATSREALGLTGEMAWRVPSLTLPDAQARLSPEQLRQYDAVHLFDERARMAVPTWDLGPQAPVVTRICRRLDGIPLAIELAAARLKVLSAEQIAARLDDRFNLLTSGSRTALPRQQTLRATMDWSYDLLSGQERTLLQRLSVFAGGWTVEAAEDVCGGSAAVLDTLASLVDKSLVVVERTGSEHRYRMLETVRQYAGERLQESGEDAQVHSRHLDYFSRFAEEAESKLHGPDQLGWLERLEAENDNLRAALDWALPARRIQQGLRMASALRQFWEMRGYWREGYERVKNLLGQPEAASRTLERAGALLNAARMTGMESLGDPEKSRQYAQELIGIAQDLGAEGKHLLALGLCVLGDHTYEQDIAAAQAMTEQALNIARELGEDWLLGYTLYMRGWLLRVTDPPTAAQFYQASLGYFRSLGDPQWIARLSMLLSIHRYAQGELGPARRGLEEVLPSLRRAKAQWEIAYTLTILGEIARAEGRYDEAKTAYAQVHETAQELGSKWLIAVQRLNLAFVAIHEGDLATARSYLAHCLTVDQALGMNLDGVFIGFAGLALAAEQPWQAAQLLGYADHLMSLKESRVMTLTDKLEYNRLLALAREQLDGTTFGAASKEGRHMTLEQAMDCALKL